MNSWNGKAVLVTGASGFVGSTLVRMLRERGANVVSLSRGMGATQLREGIQGDLTDFESLTRALDGKKFDAVFHLAAAGVNPKEPVPSLIHVNAEGTENLLKALESLPVCPVVVAGSWTEYGSSETGLMQEDMKCSPASPYGISKLASTLLATSWAMRLGRPLTVLRLFSVYGPGEQEYRLGPAVITALRDGKAPQLGSPENTRDFVYVDDVAEAFIRAADLNEPGTILNVGTGVATSIKDYVEEIRTAMKSELVPTWGTGPSRPWDVPRTQADVRRLQEVLGWSPQITLKEGVSKTVV